MGYSTMLEGKGFDQPRNSVKQIDFYLFYALPYEPNLY